MNNCLMWILLLCFCNNGCKGNEKREGQCSCGCGEKRMPPPRPRCMMPEDGFFMRKADEEDASFLDEKE